MTEKFQTEIENGKGQSLTQLARLVPEFRPGKKPSLSRLYRWAVDGKKIGKKVVRLEAIKSPGGWLSTPGAMFRFFQAITDATISNDESSPKHN